MSLDLASLQKAVARHGQVARVVVADVAGSAPREVGASMLVWREAGRICQEGTIGGGGLELNAATRALDGPFLERIPLGPSLGQCCGGAVTLLCEIFDADTLKTLQDQTLRAIPLTGGEMPLSVRRRLAQTRNSGRTCPAQQFQGWFLEPIAPPRIPLWIHGAGHVGRALVATLSPLAQFDITWVDTAQDRFPDPLPNGVTCLPTPHPDRAVRLAPQDAQHLILTYSHEIDLALCHAVLSQPFAGAGLIGSATKWARFQRRLAALGHRDEQISRITCPIGDPSLGKAPQAIAVGVAAALLKDAARRNDKGNTNRGQAFDQTGDGRHAAEA